MPGLQAGSALPRAQERAGPVPTVSLGSEQEVHGFRANAVERPRRSDVSQSSQPRKIRSVVENRARGDRDGPTSGHLSPKVFDEGRNSSVTDAAIEGSD